MAEQRQRLSDTERARRLDEAVGRFVSDVIGLDYPAQAIVDRIAAELSHYPNRKTK